MRVVVNQGLGTKSRFFVPQNDSGLQPNPHQPLQIQPVPKIVRVIDIVAQQRRLVFSLEDCGPGVVDVGVGGFGFGGGLLCGLGVEVHSVGAVGRVAK